MSPLIVNWHRASEASLLTYGLPAVVNIPDILDHIEDGETLMVDGDAATVRRLDNP